VLEIAESGATGESGLDATSVFIGEEGTVGIVQPKGAAARTGLDGEQALRDLLLELLEASGAQTPGLLAVAKKSSTGGDVASVIAQLESALIPVNRAAGRRALARLVREAKRIQLGVGRNAAGPTDAAPQSRRVATLARPEIRKEASPASIPVLGSVLFGSPKLSEPPKAEMPFQIEKEDIDQLLRTFEISDLKPEVEMARELKSMAGLEPTPPPPNAKTHVADEEVGSIEDLLKLSEPVAASSRPQAAPPPPIASPPRARPASSPPLIASSDPPTKIEAMDAFIEPRKSLSPGSKPSSPPRTAASLSNRPGKATEKAAENGRQAAQERPRTSSSAKLLVIAFLATLLVGMVAVYLLFPKLIPGILQPVRERSNAAVTASVSPVAAPQCRGRIVVRKAPADAEILLRAGAAPTEVQRLPIGTRIEFVATAEGYAPRRGVVLPTAVWTHDAQPSFDLTIALPVSKKSSAEAWPPAEAGTQVGGRGEPGLVRVSSSPIGAEIWLLAGLGPEASYEPLPCDRESEILIAGPTTYRKRIRITPAELEKAPEGQGQSKGLRVLEVVIRSSD
jgi:hypothetical protein